MYWLKQVFSVNYRRSGNEISFHVGWFYILLLIAFVSKAFGWI